MDHDHDILSLRSRVTELVHQEGVLVSEALQHGRDGDRQRIDDLFSQLQALQLDRSGLQKKIATLLGPRRMHVASEVWRPGEYDYCLEAGGAAVRISVVQSPFGLHAMFPDRDQPIAVEALKGTFDGPVVRSASRPPLSGDAEPRSTPARKSAKAVRGGPSRQNKPGAS